MNDQTAQITTNSSRKPPLLMTWVVVSAFIVVAAYLQTAGMLRLAILTQLLSGYDVFAFKRFDVPRLPPAKNFEINGQKGGKLSAIAIQDKYAYLGAGESLLVLNIENPKEIAIASSLLLLGQITDIELADNFAYVCNGRGGLRIVDVHNPEKPKEVAAYGHMAVPKRVCVKHDCAYIAAGMKGLEVLDVRNPMHPVAVSFVDSSGNAGTLDAKNICIDDNRLCVMDEDQGLRLFDIKDPRNPSKLGEWKTGGRGLRRGAAAVDGKTILIAGDSPDEGISLLNIDGDKPELTSSLDVPQYWYGTCARIHDGFAYIGTSSGLLVVDIHDKKKPKRLSIFNGVTGIMDLDVKGANVYATTAAGDLSIIDISDPFTPLLVSSHHVGGDVQLLTILDDTLYGASSPSEIQSFKLPLDVKSRPAVQSLDFKGIRAFGQAGEDLVVSDERFPARGSRVSLVTLLKKQKDGKFKETWSQTVEKSNREIAGTSNHIFAAAENGIHIFNKSGNERFFYPLKTGADLLTVSGECLYVVTETGPKDTLLITFDAKDPEHLRKLGQTSIDQRAFSLVTDTRHVYILEGGIWGDRELSIFDKAQNGALSRSGTLKIKQADRLAVDGKRAYVQGFLEVNSVDISNAKNPKLVGTVDLSAIPLAASDIEAKNGIVYIAGQDGGIYMLKDKTLE